MKHDFWKPALLPSLEKEST